MHDAGSPEFVRDFGDTENGPGRFIEFKRDTVGDIRVFSRA
jgi:hypothetical protein